MHVGVRWAVEALRQWDAGDGQELAWFDEDEHGSSAVSSRLANDAAAVRGAVGDQLGLLVQNLVTVIAGAPPPTGAQAEHLCTLCPVPRLV